MDTPTENSTSLLNELGGDAQKMGEAASGRIHGEIDDRKGEVTSQVKSLSSTLEGVADDVAPNSPAWIKSAIQQGATTLQRFAETIDQKDSRQLTKDVQKLARDNPGTFLIGCAVAGFAAARVFKAGARGEPDGQTSPYPSAPAVQMPPYSQPTRGGDHPAMPFAQDAGTMPHPGEAT